MTGRFALAVATALLSLAPAAPAMDAAAVGAHVSIQFGAVAPTQVDVLPGEEVDWSNDSVRNHTVSADGGSFDSGTLAPGTGFSHVFSDVGAFAYHCRLHPYIRGEVDVRRVLLDRPVAPAAAGKHYPLSGRAAAAPGTAVAIEFDDGSGAGFRSVGGADVGPDGHFTADIVPTESGSYRALLGAEASPPVDLVVLNRAITAHGTRDRITATVTPAAPGATVVLQLHLKERFGWWPVAQTKLDRHSHARFTLRHHRAVTARVVLTLPDGATVLATSSRLRLRASK